MKYVVIEFTGGMNAGHELAFIFSDIVDHGMFTRKVTNDFSLGKPVGAGKCYIDDKGEFVPHGESISLKVKSRGLVDKYHLKRLTITA